MSLPNYTAVTPSFSLFCLTNSWTLKNIQFTDTCEKEIKLFLTDNVLHLRLKILQNHQSSDRCQSKGLCVIGLC